MLLCDETVTLVRAEGGAYTCDVMEGASWFSRRGGEARGPGQESAGLTRVRIPEGSLTVLPRPGDYLVRGRALIRGAADLRGHEYIRVTEVTDCRRGAAGLRHVAVRGL